MAKSKKEVEPVSFVRSKDIKKTKFKPQREEDLDAKLKRLQKKLYAGSGD